MITKRHYQEALEVQDACNLSGVVFSFAKVMQEICDDANAAGFGTDWKNQHPIAVLYASKIASLTRCESTGIFESAFNLATKIVRANKP